MNLTDYRKLKEETVIKSVKSENKAEWTITKLETIIVSQESFIVEEKQINKQTYCSREFNNLAAAETYFESKKQQFLEENKK